MGNNMRINRVIAAAVSAAIVFTFAGCDAFGVRKAMGVMHDRITRYNQALNSLDYETIRELSDWTEEDNDYTAIEELFDTSYYGDEEGEGFVDCAEYIASTITIKFNVTGARIDGNFSEIDVTYEMVDWQSVYSEPHDSYEDVLADLKNCPDKNTIESTITLENVDKAEDWRLCRLNNLTEVMSFVHTLPEIDAPESTDGIDL